MSEIGYYSAASGMELELRRQEVISKNLAAANIPGYKREFVSSETFSNKFSKMLDNKITPYLGSTAGATKTDFSQGCLRDTDRRLDFAIQGDGFFEVQTPDGKTMYTRNGAFFINKESKLVTNEGYTVMGEGGPMFFATNDNPQEINVTGDGMVKVMQGRDAFYQLKDIGRLKITEIKDKTKLQRASAKYFFLSDKNKGLARPLEDKNNFQISNGYLEMSNSSPLMEMTSMITCQRDFELGQKMIKMLDDRFKQEQRYLGQ